MKILREQIRRILFERKIARALDKNKLIKALREKAEQFSAKDYGEVGFNANNKNVVIMTIAVSPFEPYKEDPLDVSMGDIFGSMRRQREYNKEMAGKVDVNKWLKSLERRYEKAFDQAANNRGWNVLKVRFEAPPGAGYKVFIEYIFDMLASKENTNYFGQSDQLHAEGYRCFHLTKSDYVPRIMASGIKPTNVSSDHVRFGSGRSYYVLTKADDDSVREFFAKMMESEGFAGHWSDDRQTVLEVDLDNDLDIKFYIDTEFGRGDGTVRGKGGGNPRAVWTPSHVPEELLEIYMEGEP